jgi:transcriptional regulator with XRE-family HTH domain
MSRGAAGGLRDITAAALAMVSRREPELTIREVTDLLAEAIQRLENDLSFENALEVCTAARVAWATYYSAWLRGGRAPENETADLKRALADALDALERLPPPGGDTTGGGGQGQAEQPTPRELLAHYIRNVRARSEMLALLVDEGAEAVDRDLSERVSKLQQRGT